MTPRSIFLSFMDCLTHLISLDNCETTDQNAVYDLARHTGLSRTQLDELIDDSYATIDDWFEAMRELAADRLATDVLTHIDNSVKLNTLIENSIVGDIDESLTETTHSNYVGIMFDSIDIQEYLSLTINKISLFTNHDGDVDVLVVDFVTGEVLKTITITCVAGQNVSSSIAVNIPTNARERKIGVIYDASSVTSYKTTLYNSGCSDCGSVGYYGSRYASISAINVSGAPLILANKSKANNTGGLQIDFSFSCNQKQWVCSVSNQMALAMLYKTGYEMLSYSINSASQFSDQQTINFDRNVERMTSFEYKYGEELSKIMKRIKIPKGLCFYCNQRTQVIKRLPS